MCKENTYIFNRCFRFSKSLHNKTFKIMFRVVTVYIAAKLFTGLLHCICKESSWINVFVAESPFIFDKEESCGR